MNEIVIYEDGEVHLELSLEKETFWLDANDIADIFDVKRPAVVKHIGNIYKSDELDKEVTCSKRLRYGMCKICTYHSAWRY